MSWTLLPSMAFSTCPCQRSPGRVWRSREALILARMEARKSVRIRLRAWQKPLLSPVGTGRPAARDHAWMRLSALEQEALASRIWASQAQKTGMCPKWRWRDVGSISRRKAQGRKYPKSKA